jgi:Tol biopolymer transport system component/murein DD-endopeptidase MepM/ murein hydrolase activator NlpD
MTKFFKYILLPAVIFSFIVTSPLGYIYAEDLFRAPVVGTFPITNGPCEGMHTGVSEYAIDISTSGKSINIYAVGDGVVEVAGVYVKNKEEKVYVVEYGSNLEGLEIVGFGNYIIIAHDNGYKSLYAHLSEIYVNKGEEVSRGQIIAKSGNTGLSYGQTGMHLHFEIRKDDKSIDLIGILENFSRDNFTSEYWGWRDGEVDMLPSSSSGNITGSPVDVSKSESETLNKQGHDKESLHFLDTIKYFFNKIGKFFTSIFSYRNPRETSAKEKECKIIEDEYQLTVIDEMEKSRDEDENRIEEVGLNSIRINKMLLKIVFSGQIGFCEQDIFLLDLEKANLKRLTYSFRDGVYGAYSIDPEISMDSSKIVYSSNIEKGIEVYFMNSDGSGQEMLTDTGAENPSISKDGKKIVYIGRDQEGYGNLFIMNSDGSNKKMLNTENILEPYSHPSFSFDNKRIVFEGYVDYDSEKYNGINDLFIIDTDGEKIQRIFNDLDEHNPSFSPDGSKIIFDAYKSEDYASHSYNNTEIFIMELDSTTVKQLTDNNCKDYRPIFVSDGEKILFESDREGFSGIYIMNIDGSNQSLITTKQLGNYEPAISPDGKKIAFISSVDGNPELYLMNSDGSGKKRLTSNNCFDDNPVFSPTGSSIFYNSVLNGRGIYKINIDTLKVEKVYEDVFFSNLDFSEEKNKVVFEAMGDFDYSEILIMDMDGSNSIMLTSNDVYDGNPIFDANSSKIIYISNIDMSAEIYSMNLDGSQKSRITNNELAEFSLQFSGDKSELLVIDGNGINVLNYNDLKNIEKKYDADEGWIDYANFVPNSSKILFLMTGLEDKNNQIILLDTRDSDFIKIAENINSFVLSEDGKKIIYTSNESGVPELYSVNTDGSDLIKLTYFEYLNNN